MVSTTRSTMPQALTFEMDEDALAFDPGRVIPIDYSQRVEPPIFFSSPPNAWLAEDQSFAIIMGILTLVLRLFTLLHWL